VLSERDFSTDDPRMNYGAYDWQVIAMMVLAAISFLVVTVMFYSIVLHRKQAGEKVKQFHRNPVVEILWAAIPILIMLALAAPAVKELIQKKESASPGASVEATGYKWKQEDAVDKPR
jgi:cytochrome c oxidase subunit II